MRPRKKKIRERQKKLAIRSHRKSKLPASEVKLNQEEGIRAAFYVPWDAASFSSLRDFSRQIDLLYPDWLHVLTPDGRLQGVDDQKPTSSSMWCRITGPGPWTTA